MFELMECGHLGYGKTMDNKPYCIMCDCDKTSNKVENLEWCTIKENNIHARKIGLTNDYGSNNKLSKFSNEEIKFIRQNYIKNDKEYGCRALAKKFNVSKSTISYIVNNITYFILFVLEHYTS